MVLEVGYSGLQKTALPMRPRVSVQDSALRNGNFSLRINPVRSEDAGLYEAQVAHNKEVQTCWVELGVITGRRKWKPWRMSILGLGRLQGWNGVGMMCLPGQVRVQAAAPRKRGASCCLLSALERGMPEGQS